MGPLGQESGGADDDVFEFEFTSAPPILSAAEDSMPGPNTKQKPKRGTGANRRRRRIWTGSIATAAVLAILTGGGFMLRAQLKASDTPPPRALTAPTAETQTPAELEPIEPAVLSAKVARNAPTEAWRVTATDLGSDARGLTPVYAVGNNLTSPVVVARLQGERTNQLLGLDGTTGETLWRIDIGNGDDLCTLINSGHETACLRRGATRTYVTIYSSSTGREYGTSAWETDCIATGVAGSAEKLIIAGLTLGTRSPCLATGALWDRQVEVIDLTAAIADPLEWFKPDEVDQAPDGTPEAWGDGLGEPTISLEGDYLWVFLGDRQILATASLDRVIATSPGSSPTARLSVLPGLGAVSMDSDPDTMETRTSFLDEPLSELGKLKGLPWQRIDPARFPPDAPVGVGRTLLSRDGRTLMTLPINPQDEFSLDVLQTPSTIVMETPLAESMDVISGVHLRALDTDGNQKWETEIGPTTMQLTAIGDILLYAATPEPSPDTDARQGRMLRALDLKTGKWAWDMNLQSPEQTDGDWYVEWPFISGTNLIQAGYNTITAYTFP